MCKKERKLFMIIKYKLNDTRELNRLPQMNKGRLEVEIIIAVNSFIQYPNMVRRELFKQF